MNRTAPITAPAECKVFTPARLAQAMAGVLADGPGFEWLEPCVGQGVFLDALASKGVARERITAIELDQHDLTKQCGDYISGTDFLAWSLATPKRFDRIIGNPPFLKLHRAHHAVVKAALQIARPAGGTVPLGSNCWYAFVCAALRLLKPNGGLCLVLPSGWDYANYASDLRDKMPGMFSRFEIVRSDRSFFSGILDGCVVLVADGYQQPCCQQRRFDLSTLDEVIEHLTSTPSPASQPESRVDASVAATHGLVRFGDVARVRIGAVTGDASYFLLNEVRRMELGLGSEDVRPVLTRAKHLDGPDIGMARWNKLRDEGERVWLFWPRRRPGRRPEAVEKYLSEGKRLKRHTRQKTRDRETWYLTRMNPEADGFMSGMTSVGPWLCLNRAKRLTATNTLYTIHFKGSRPLREKAAWALSLLSTTVATQYGQIGRCYSKGLLKFEPRDVMALMVPRPIDATEMAIEVYQRVIEDLLEDRVERAREGAEAFVRTGKYSVPNSASARMSR
jgi:adenine-specific DNA-methyltransferase